MQGGSIKKSERILFVVTAFIFLLLLVLKFFPAGLFLSLPVDAPSAAGGGPSNKNFVAEAEEADHQPQITAGSPYTLGPAQKRDFRIRVDVTNTGNTPSTNIRMEVPLLDELDSPYQIMVKESFSQAPLEIKKKEAGNRSAFFQIDALAPRESKTLVLNYQLQTCSLKSKLPVTGASSDLQAHHSMKCLPHNTNNSGQIQPHLKPWLEPATKIESDHPQIIDRARELTATTDGDLEKARLIFNYVKGYLRYDLNSPHRNKGALSALQNRAGVCEDYAALFVALCRAAGVPARQVNGYTDPEGCGLAWKLAPAETLSLKGCRHSWAEFYLDGSGWLPADPTMNINDTRLTYFASLPGAGYLAQNYADQPLQVRFQGGKLAVSWEEELSGF
ncbi:MAG: transglutaminase domain-containing protein [Firmicutes bacterium]|nr:transglutaminase domain-containing protein [Bacillota bacterium]